MKTRNNMQLKRRESSAVMPQMFGNLNPPPLKPIPYSGGYIKLIWEGGKLERIKEMHLRQAEIYEAMYRQTKAMSDSFYETMTLGRRIELFHEEASHRMVMMGHEETKGEAEALNAVYEARISEYEFRMREREYNRVLRENSEEE